MSTGAITLQTLTINNYLGVITLTKDLTLNTGGSMNNGTILQGTGATGTNLNVTGGTFTWSGGWINQGTGTSAANLNISAGAEVDFTLTSSSAGGYFGDNISNSGTLKLANTGSVTLYYTPTITNAAGGKILITVADTGPGLDIASGTAKVTIQNSGTIQKTTDNGGEYDITDPVNNKASGATLQVDKGTLRFLGGDPSSGIGVTQSAGVIQVSADATLKADAGLSQSGGTTKTSGAGIAYIKGALTVSGGTVQVGDGGPTVATLDLDSNLTWSGGTVSLYYDLGSTNSVIDVAGNATITAATTTLTVNIVGTGAPAATFVAIWASGTINTVANTNNVTNYTASIANDPVSGKDYLLTLNPPSVSAVSPASGSTSGGTSVTITGSAFTGATAVYFGSTAATSFTVNSDGSITAVAPAESAGTVDITVVTAGGTSATSSSDHFTYGAPPVVTLVTPSSGGSPGGSSVYLSGSGFTGATAVYFGSVPATSFRVNSDGSIMAVAPAGTGTVDITVVTAYGTSATSSGDRFTYY